MLTLDFETCGVVEDSGASPDFAMSDFSHDVMVVPSFVASIIFCQDSTTSGQQALRLAGTNACACLPARHIRTSLPAYRKVLSR